MPMMRVLFIALVLLNLLALAFSRGWLGAPAADGEPERLTNQLNPERIVLRPPEAPAAAPPSTADSAPLAASAPPQSEPQARDGKANGREDACIALTGLTEAQAENLVQRLPAVAPDVRASHETASAPSSWWVRIPPNGGREAAERRVAELRSLGVEDLFIVQEPGPNQFSVSLGLFKSEAKAQQHLTMLQNKHVRTASIATRSTTTHRVEVRGPAAVLDTVSASRTVRQAGANIGECKP